MYWLVEMTYFATYFLGAPAPSLNFFPPGDPESFPDIFWKGKIE